MNIWNLDVRYAHKTQTKQKTKSGSNFVTISASAKKNLLEFILALMCSTLQIMCTTMNISKWTKWKEFFFSIFFQI